MISPPIERIYLQPGELYLGEGPAVISTVLGSCIAVTMWDPSTGCAAVSHCVLPGSERPDEERSPDRYVSHCIPRMLAWFSRRGIPLERLAVRLIGGAAGTFQTGRSVGQQNTEAALRILRGKGIRLSSRGTGGIYGRKLVFDSSSGTARVTSLGTRPAPQKRTIRCEAGC